ncbi:hypothetical protein M422DRAFT_262972 [Sphaerobolus stellatus SS14]|uniref:Uncharacterized protein n=1 Tax=Sphaerobolus stellatus (strain SS14) TaxID=990650 RepID=A0A0C9TWK6_SPHS4|nr:hypothetical protein M422DRAFT_262972 [Sphaerobolus stellatus SS14]
MAPKKKTSDKVPTGTGDAVDSGSTSNIASENDPTLDPGKDPSRRYYPEPSERLASADPDPKELTLGNQIKEMLNTINKHMDEVKTIHNMSCQAAQLLEKTNESNSALKARTRTLENYLMIAKGKSSIHPRDPTRNPNDEEINPHSERLTHWSNNHTDEELTNGQPNIDPEVMQTTPNNRSGTKHALSKARTELSAKTAVLEWLYADQAPANHLNQAATAARNTRMEYDENTRVDERWANLCKSIHYTPFNGIEDNDTDSETTVRDHWEGSIPFQHLDDRDILDMSNNESDNPLVQMVKYMLDQNINTTMEKSPLAKAGVKVTPPDKYSEEQSFKAL